jgi:broad specificity phosphatase PhoE
MGKFQGQGEVGLTTLGREQANQAAHVLRTMSPVSLFSSPLTRTMETSRAIGQVCSLEVRPLEDLKELDLGDVDGFDNIKLRAQYPDLYNHWRRDPTHAQMPGGESLAQLQVRAWRAVEQICNGQNGSTVVAVSHHFAIVTVLCRLLEMPLSRFRRLQVALGSITTIEHTEGGWRLLSMNQRPMVAPDPVDER